MVDHERPTTAECNAAIMPSLWANVLLYGISCQNLSRDVTYHNKAKQTRNDKQAAQGLDGIDIAVDSTDGVGAGLGATLMTFTLVCSWLIFFKHLK